jgi:hypothetical protein
MSNAAVESPLLAINWRLSERTDSLCQQGCSYWFTGTRLEWYPIELKGDGLSGVELTKHRMLIDSHGASPMPARSLMRTGLTG